jgi:hypothetical protein
MLNVEQFSSLHLRTHADQNRPTIADVTHSNNFREGPRHLVDSPDPYRQLQVQSALSSPIHFPLRISLQRFKRIITMNASERNVTSVTRIEFPKFRRIGCTELETGFTNGFG